MHQKKMLKIVIFSTIFLSLVDERCSFFMRPDCYYNSKCYGIPVGLKICYCDNICSSYDDCCRETLTRNEAPPKKVASCIRPDFWSWKDSQYPDIYVKTNCPMNWKRDDSIKRLCEWNYTSVEDPYARLPLTNPHSQMTYKNYYCALCNDDILQSVPWKMTIDCKSVWVYNMTYGNMTTKYLKENWVYSRTDDAWGIYLYNKGKREFFSCKMSLELGDLEKKARACLSDLVSDCAPSWKLKDVREKCLSYKYVINVGGEKYRNVHCAICNYKQVRHLFVVITSWACATPGVEFTPFNVLVNLSVREKCVAGYFFDIFSKTCRKVECLPGEELVNGECV